MKVLNLQCAQMHLFEGWFASEGDYLSQQERGLVACPICNDATITKRLSAPRLNLGGSRVEPADRPDAPSDTPTNTGLQAAVMMVARHILANTDDVGVNFAAEARKMHYGESEVRGIRGQATSAEAVSLIDEGIAVLPFGIPESLKGPLH